MSVAGSAGLGQTGSMHQHPRTNERIGFRFEGVIGGDKVFQSFYRGLPGPWLESSIRDPASVSLRMCICAPSLSRTASICKSYKGVSTFAWLAHLWATGEPSSNHDGRHHLRCVQCDHVGCNVANCADCSGFDKEMLQHENAEYFCSEHAE